MNLREEILREHSKAQCNNIVEWVGNSQRRFDQLFRLFCGDEYRVTQRAAWPVSYCVIANPVFIQKHFAGLLKHLHKPGIHIAVKRNAVRLLQDIDIPEVYRGEVMDICFRYVEDPKEAVAVKAFSLTVLGRLAEQYPEIIPEIKLLIEDQFDSQTPAFRSRARRLLKAFERK